MFAGGAALLIGVAVTLVLVAPFDSANTTTEVSASEEERTLRSRVDHLEWQNQRLRGHLQAWPERCAAQASASQEADTPPAPQTLADARRIVGADAAYDQAVRDADVQSLIELGTELLQSGEPGYEKFTELATRLLTEDNEELKLLWGDSEALVAPLVIAAARNPEPLLRYGLYLDQQDPDAVHPMLRHVHSEFMGNPASMLLQASAGTDPELEGEYLAYFETQYRSDGHLSRDAYPAIAENPDPAAGELLAELAMSSSLKGEQTAAMRALARRGDPQAQATLRQIVEQSEQEDEIDLRDIESIDDPEMRRQLVELWMVTQGQGGKTDLAERLLETFP